MTSYALNSEDYIAEHFDGDYVVLNKKSGVYFEIAERSAAVLTALLRGVDATHLLNALRQKDATLADGAETTVRKMREISALCISREVGAEPETKDIEEIEAKASFVFEGFDDLSALILADPVHDLDDLEALNTEGAKALNS